VDGKGANRVDVGEGREIVTGNIKHERKGIESKGLDRSLSCCCCFILLHVRHNLKDN
jgi:hypothetical protein